MAFLIEKHFLPRGAFEFQMVENQTKGLQGAIDGSRRDRASVIGVATLLT